MTATAAHSPTLGLALLVALAGGVGAMARALLIHHISVRRADPLPIGTVVVNASGSLVLGFLTGLSIYHGLAPRFLSVVGIGLCGGYTTFSTASWESLHLVRTGQRRAAIVMTASVGGDAMRNTGGAKMNAATREVENGIVAKTEPNGNTTTVSIVADRKLSYQEKQRATCNFILLRPLLFSQHRQSPPRLDAFPRSLEFHRLDSG